MDKQHNRKRILCFAVILALLCFLNYFFNQPKLLTGRRTDLQQVVIVEDPNFAGKNIETVISDSGRLNALYDALLGIRTSANRHPRHTESLQFNSDYRVTFIYTNTKDEVFVHLGEAYRFLETRGGSGDPGYTHGSAEKLTRVIQR